MSQAINIPFPLKGLAEVSAYARQPEGTTPDCKNVRGFDPRTGRLRGGQRSGISKFVNSQVNGSNVIQCVTSVVKQVSNITYSLRVSPTVVWEKAIPSKMDAIAMACDSLGNLYVAGGSGGGGTLVNYIAKYNPAGTMLWAVPVPLADTGHVIKSIKLDEDGAIYIAIAGTGTVTAQLYRLEEVTGAEVLRRVWRIDAPNAGLWVDISVKNGVMYAIENTAGTSRVHRYDGAMTSDPVLVWSYNLGATGYIAVATALDGSAYCSLPGTSGAAKGTLKKVGPRGDLIWSITTSQGVGHAVVVGPDGSIYTQGVHDWTLAAGSQRHVSKITDNGTTTTNVWEVKTEETTFQGATSLTIDPQSNVYQAVTSGANTTVYRIKSDGSGTDWSYNYTDTSSIDGMSVVIDPLSVMDGATEKSEHLYIGLDSTGTVGYGIAKLSMLSTTVGSSSPRSIETIAVCQGTIKKESGGAWSTISGVTLDTGSRFIQAASGYNRVLFLDGTTYATYDAVSGTLAEWKATSAGAIPARAKLLAIWNGRAVIGRFSDDPQNWAMSAVDDFDDWDFGPPDVTVTQAVLGNNSDAGRCPDIINAIIPYSDDLLLFGGDHTIYRMTGDPMAGGRLDRVTDITGIAFGNTWAKDERGVVYFFGSRGGVFRMVPGAIPEQISGNIDVRMREIDVSTNKIGLAWNDTEGTLHVFITPWAGGATTHYAWERDTESWWVDVFGTNAHNPLAVHIVDGDDPGDRLLLLGGSDGYVRHWDSAQDDDDGTYIESYAFCGPVMPGGDVQESKIHGLTGVLSAGSGTVTATAYASTRAEFSTIGSAVYTATLTAGRNSPSWERSRGMAHWFKIGRLSPASAAYWDLETLNASAMPAGKVRVRT